MVKISGPDFARDGSNAFPIGDFHTCYVQVEKYQVVKFLQFSPNLESHFSSLSVCATTTRQSRRGWGRSTGNSLVMSLRRKSSWRWADCTEMWGVQVGLSSPLLTVYFLQVTEEKLTFKLTQLVFKNQQNLKNNRVEKVGVQVIYSNYFE